MPTRRCAIYTRKSSEEGLEQDFNSLHAQREACEAYITSQKSEGWQLVRTPYDDGAFSGGTLERPALQSLLADIEARKVDTVVVYKVDRLTRSLANFSKIVEIFDAHAVSFVSITQQFNTTTSMGRLTLNMLLSFAQFEREVTGERIRDKIAASKKKGMWMGGFVPLGYEAKERTLVINEVEAKTIRAVYRLYLAHGNVRRVKAEADRLGLKTKIRAEGSSGGRPLSRGYIYKLLGNPLYAGKIAHKGEVYEGQHPAIIDAKTWKEVQTKLTSNTHARRSGVRATEPSLLAGLLHDEHGNRLSPSHAVKNGTRYRYYVSQAILQHREGEAGSVIRIPAREIEKLVTARMASLLKDSGALIDEIGNALKPRDQKRLMSAARKQAEQWPQMKAAERRAFVLTVVAKVTVSDGEVRIVLRRSQLQKSLLSDTSPTRTTNLNREEENGSNTDDALILSTPARLKLCSGEMRLVIPPGHVKETQPRPNATLIKALARAHAWKAKLLSGDTPSIRAIAKDEGVNERYVGHHLRLSFLAPDIVEAILDGYQPIDLDMKRLLKGIPLIWGEQRREFGLNGV
ncbi:MAG: resolvase [Rhodospirillaceae bacterium]|nr:MAG: resolvase [Rhodospirillaceae bacterium]